MLEGRSSGVARKLDRYEDRRDFERTPEPPGRDGGSVDGIGRFVVQEHSARSMHWDLRLERDGVAVSWAVPRGLPALPKVNHLAKQTEDHPLEYLDFEGDIPAGSYGAGSMRIYDAGTYDTEIWDGDKVQVVLHGERLRGRYGLVRTGGNDWLVHRMETATDPARKPMPRDLEPMMAQAASDPPRGEDWGFEIKWDGIRALVWASGGRIDRIRSRNGVDITERYPELARMGRQVGAHEVVLDGEIVAFDEEGSPSFSLLQERMQLTKPAAIRRTAQRVPVTLVLFDVLFLDGHDTTALPYRDRRRLLELLELEGSAWQTPPYDTGDGKAMLEEAHELGLEGVVAKRLDSPYQCGKRSGAWRKVKLQRRQEFVIGGWIEGEGRRAGSVGSLAVGYYRERGLPGQPGELVFAGAVGTGYTDAMLDTLHAMLTPLEQDESPFDPGGPTVQSGGGRWGRRKLTPRVHWVEPRLVCEVEYTEFTHEGVLRHPSFKGLRDDKDSRDVVLEDPKFVPVEPSATAGLPETEAASQTGSQAPSGAGRGARQSHTYHLDGHAVRLSNPDKVLYPAAGFTKRDIADYYLAAAPVLLPHLRDRPLTMRRFPDGVDGQFFFEKNAPAHRPDWMRTVPVPRREDRAGSENDTIDFLVIDERAGLTWVANLAALELHVPLARAPHVERPDMVVFDLDPGAPATIVECCEVAVHLREICEASGLRLWPKTSGRKGLQLYVPLNDPDVTYEHTRAFSNAVARLLERQYPALVVSKMTKVLRTGKVLVDWSQNHVTKTTICVYSLREFEQPTVSMPVTWSEVEECLETRDPELLRFTAPEALIRIGQHGDLFADVLTVQQRIPRA